MFQKKLAFDLKENPQGGLYRAPNSLKCSDKMAQVFIQAATGWQSNTARQARSLVRLEWQAEVCFSSYRRADQRRLALAWPVITLITQENDNNTGSLMTEVIVVEVPRYAVVA